MIIKKYTKLLTTFNNNISSTIVRVIIHYFIERVGVRTKRHDNVHTTSLQCYGRCLDIKTTLCTFGGSDFTGKAEDYQE